MMMSHFFHGFAQGLDGRDKAGPEDLVHAMLLASNSLYQAVEQPIEGTILTVVRESVQEVKRAHIDVRDLGELARRMLGAARESLARTRDQLPSLRKANVVDAGALGFVRFLEGVMCLIEGKTPSRRGEPAVEAAVADAAATAEYPTDRDRAYTFCCEYVLRGDSLPGRPALAAAVRELGASLIVTRAAAVAKLHIHTNEPARVEGALARLGPEVECVKAEDMRAQHQHRRRVLTRTVAVVTDSTCDLPSESIIEHDITVVPLTVLIGDAAYLDQVDIDHEHFLERLTDPDQVPPTTSQPTPALFQASFERAAEHADEVLGIFVAGALSGTLGQAQAVAKRFSHASARVYDSCAASLGLGFQVLKAAELARDGRSLEEIVAELDRLKERSGLLLTVDTLTYLKRSGRIGKARAFLGNLLHLKPVLGVDERGALEPVDRVMGREALGPRVLEILEGWIPRDRARLRMGVAHVGCLDVAQGLAEDLRHRFGPDELFVVPGGCAIAAHTGPGAWAVFYQAE